MATGMVDVTTLYAEKHGELNDPIAASPALEDPDYLGPAFPETVARNIARRARLRVFATMAPLTFLVVLLLLIVGHTGL